MPVAIFEPMHDGLCRIVISDSRAGSHPGRRIGKAAALTCPAPGSYGNGMPSLGQHGSSMKRRAFQQDEQSDPLSPIIVRQTRQCGGAIKSQTRR